MVKGRTQNRGADEMSSQDTSNQPRGVAVRRVAEPPAPKNHLLERILARENMRCACKRVAANKGVAGIDKMTVADFKSHARQHWPDIRQSLLAGTYQPLPVLRVEISKSSGGRRPLGIPTVVDRVIQQAMAQVLVPIFDPEFSEQSYGFRPGRSAHDAAKQVRAYTG
jgi:RNA-directed DNA polymerase